MKVGIDVGGTFTDFLVTDEQGRAQVGKVLSTPEDPSIGLLQGLEELARERGQDLPEATPGNVATRRQPGDPGSERGGGDRDGGGQRDRP